MTASVVQLRQMVRRLKQSYESEHATAHRSIDWDRFWAMAYRQGLRAPRRPGSTARHQQRYTPTTQNDSNHGPKEVCCTPYRELRSERRDVPNSKSPPTKQRPQQPQPQPQPQLSPQGPPGQTQTQCSIQHMRQEQQQLQVQTASAYDEDEELGTEDIPTDDIIYIDIELDDGTVATVGIAPEEDPEVGNAPFGFVR